MFQHQRRNTVTDHRQIN